MLGSYDVPNISSKYIVYSFRFCSLSHIQAAKAKKDLHNCTFSSVPLLLSHTINEGSCHNLLDSQAWVYKY